MPGPRTYQAIGYVTYQAHRRHLLRRAEELRGRAIAAGLVGAAILAAAIAARAVDGGSEQPRQTERP